MLLRGRAAGQARDRGRHASSSPTRSSRRTATPHSGSRCSARQPHVVWYVPSYEDSDRTDADPETSLAELTPGWVTPGDRAADARRAARRGVARPAVRSARRRDACRSRCAPRRPCSAAPGSPPRPRMRRTPRRRCAPGRTARLAQRLGLAARADPGDRRGCRRRPDPCGPRRLPHAARPARSRPRTPTSSPTPDASPTWRPPSRTRSASKGAPVTDPRITQAPASPARRARRPRRRPAILVRAGVRRPRRRPRHPQPRCRRPRRPRTTTRRCARPCTACAPRSDKAVVGQAGTVTGLLVALLARGHVLLEGVPGVAKTLVVRSFCARARASTPSACSSRPT